MDAGRPRLRRPADGLPARQARLAPRTSTRWAARRRYPVAGNRAPLDLLHGPVGPGLELGPQRGPAPGPSAWGTTSTCSCRCSLVRARRRWRSPTAGTPRALHPGDAAPSPEGTRSSPATSPSRTARTYRLRRPRTRARPGTSPRACRPAGVFHSRAGQGAVPLLTPRYTPPTNLAGSMGPGATGFALTFHSTPHSARVTRATVELSDDDGRSWRRVRVTRTSALTFHVGYRNPSAHGDVRYVSLRLTARDAKHKQRAGDRDPRLPAPLMEHDLYASDVVDNAEAVVRTRLHRRGARGRGVMRGAAALGPGPGHLARRHARPPRRLAGRAAAARAGGAPGVRDRRRRAAPPRRHGLDRLRANLGRARPGATPAELEGLTRPRSGPTCATGARRSGCPTGLRRPGRPRPGGGGGAPPRRPPAGRGVVGALTHMANWD